MKRLSNDGKRAIACLLAWALLHAMCALASEHGDDLLSASGTHDQITQLYESPKYTLVTTEDELNQIDEHDAIMHPKEGKNVLSGMSTAVALKKQPIPQSVFPMSASRKLLWVNINLGTLHIRCDGENRLLLKSAASGSRPSGCIQHCSKGGFSWFPSHQTAKIYRGTYASALFDKSGSDEYTTSGSFKDPYSSTAPSFNGGTATNVQIRWGEYKVKCGAYEFKIQTEDAPSCSRLQHAPTNYKCTNGKYLVASNTFDLSASVDPTNYNHYCCNLASEDHYSNIENGQHPCPNGGTTNGNKGQALSGCYARKNCQTAARNGHLCTNGKMMSSSALSTAVSQGLAEWTTSSGPSGYQTEFNSICCTTSATCDGINSQTIVANTLSTSTSRVTQSTLTTHSSLTCSTPWTSLKDNPASLSITDPSK